MKSLKKERSKLLTKLNNLILVQKKDLTSSEVVKVSQELDKIVIELMKEEKDPKVRMCSCR